MSLSETSESASLRFNKDVHITETSTTMSPLKAEVEANVCNHNPHLLDERLKLPDPTPDTANNSNSGNMNGSLGNSSMCFEPVNGFPYNVNSSEGENCAQSLSNNCASEVNAQQTLWQRSDSDCVVSDLSSLNPPSERDVLIAECGGAKQTVESIAPINDNCVEKLREHLDNTSLIEDFPDNEEDVIDGITYVVYESEQQMPDIMRLITKDLSEPYSIYTYRYFIHNWPKLCFLAMDKDVCIGAIVCKLDVHKKMVRRGYIAMLAVDSAYRRRKLGSTLVTKAIQAMIRDDCDEVVLETEITNQAALRLYENLGFVRDKRLFRYYLNGVDALRLKLWLR